MASLLKNQILKHLSKFAKNLSIDQIDLSALQGRGELKDLELNEVVLMDLLELPSWLRLTKAVCNKVSIKIQWTKLKSVPVYLCLDEVYVEVETCEKLRQVFDQVVRSSYRSGGSYGFSDMVIDGVTVSVNSVDIRFKSSAFHASFQLSRVRLESRTPNWHRTNNLRLTKLKDADRGELLIFKELEWQTLKMEASAIDKSAEFIAPLRLITNQAKCRITIKKRLQDCGILASRLVFIMDDLLWVLTDTQIQAAIHFLSSLSGLISKAAEREKRINAVQKLELQLSQQHQQQPPNKAANKSLTEIARVFNMYEIVETSIHVYSSRIDVHFCDDDKPKAENRSSHPHLVQGGAMQITLTRLAVDYYPYHLAYGGRKHWLRYSDTDTSQSDWVEKLLSDYCQQLLDLIQGDSSIPKSSISPQQEHISQSQDERRRSSGNTKVNLVTTFLKRLMASCVVLRLDDFVVHQISTASTQRKMPEKFIASDKGRLMLPASMPAVHIELTEYYFPGDDNFPVPVPNIYLHANPVQLYLDPVTIVWLSSFMLSIKPIQSGTQKDEREFVRPLDIHIEALMPRIVIPAPKDSPLHDDRPLNMQIQISRFVATNCRVGINCGRQELAECLDTFQTIPLFLNQSSFPAEKSDANCLVDEFYLHAGDRDNVSSLCDSDVQQSTLRKELLWTENKSVWCIQMEPIWADFCGVESCQNRPSPFIEAVQVTCWIAQTLWCPGRQLLADVHNVDANRVNVLVHFKSLVSLQLNHYQYLFLLRASEMLSSMMIQLTKDSEGMGQKALSVCLATILPEVDLSVLVPVKKSFDMVADSNSLRGDLSSSTTTTNNTAAVTSATANVFPIRESHSQGCIANETGSHVLTSSSSEFNLGAISQGQIVHSPLEMESIEVEKPEPVTLGAAADNRSEGSSIDDETGSNSGGLLENTVETLMPDKGVIPFSQSWKDSVSFTKQTESIEVNGSEHSHDNPTVHNVAKSPNVMSGLNMTNKIKGLFSQDSSSTSSNRSSSFDNFVAVIDKTGLEKVPDQLGKSIVSGSRSLKKGFTKAFATLDSTLINPMIKSSTSPGAAPMGISPSSTENSSLLTTPHEEDVDTMSMCSDISDDQYVLLNAEGNFLDENLLHFDNVDRNAIEIGCEVKEESSSEPSRSIASSFKRQDLMQVVTFRLGMVSAVYHSKGLDNVLKFQVEYMQSVEDGLMTWEEFQLKFSAGARGWQEEAMKYTLPTCDVRGRFERGPKIGAIDREYEELGFVRAIVRDATLSLMSSSLTHLSETFQDEVMAPPMPMKVAICNVKFQLEENRSSQVGSAAASIPSVLELNNLAVARKSDGKIKVTCGTVADISQMKEEIPNNEKVANERINNLEKENEALRQTVMNLRIELERSNQSQRLNTEVESELSVLNEKKASLLATLVVLQEEVAASNERLAKTKLRDG
ncbi:hypothetical protein CHUAL_010207 [Chamberlinius hualienensis]